jgi:hypothetical protein
VSPAVPSSRTNSSPNYASSRVWHFLRIRASIGAGSSPDSYGVIGDLAFTISDYISAHEYPVRPRGRGVGRDEARCQSPWSRTAAIYQ